MRRRAVILLAIAALLIVAAVPAFAAPGGEPGPPADHVKGADDVEVAEGDGMEGPPEWAKAYGWRIKDALGLPYGHLLQCNDDPDAFEACAEALLVEGLMFPEDEPGAKMFWTVNGPLFAL